MSTDETTETEEAAVQPRALFFELENVGFSGRDIEFNALKDALKKKKVSLSAPMFSRYCLATAPAAYMPKLLDACGKASDGAAKIASEVNSKMANALIGATPNTALKDVLKSALADDVKLGAVSSMEPDAAKKLIEKLGLSETDIVLHSENGYVEAVGINPEAWHHRARSMKISPRACVVIGSHADLCLSAIAAQMQCVVVTDKYTNFQDFGGADYVMDTLDAAIVVEMLKPEDDA